MYFGSKGLIFFFGRSLNIKSYLDIDRTAIDTLLYSDLLIRCFWMSGMGFYVCDGICLKQPVSAGNKAFNITIVIM